MVGVLVDLIANKMSCNSNRYTNGNSFSLISFITGDVIIEYVATWWHGAGHVQRLRYLSLSADAIFEYNRVIVIRLVTH